MRAESPTYGTQGWLSSTDQTQPQPRNAFKIAIATEHHRVLAQLQATGRLQGIGGAEPMLGSQRCGLLHHIWAELLPQQIAASEKAIEALQT